LAILAAIPPGLTYLILIKVLINQPCFKLFFVTRHAMDSKRKVEIFSAGCALCHEVIDAVKIEVGSSSQINVRDMIDARVLARAEQLGIRSVPAVVIDGKLASCCTGKGVDIQALKNELGKAP
jgi:glutaredoxin 3